MVESEGRQDLRQSDVLLQSDVIRILAELGKGMDLQTI